MTVTALDSIIETKAVDFSRRAKKLSHWANAIIIIIVVLLLLGIGIFAFAKQITEIGSTINYNEKLIQITQQKDDLNARFTASMNIRNSFLLKIREIFSKFSANNLQDGKPINDRPDGIFSKEDWDKSISVATQSLDPNSLVMQPEIGITVKVSSLSEIQKLIDQLEFPLFGEEDNRLRESFFKNNDLLSGAVRVLQQKILEQSVESITGIDTDQNKNKKPNNVAEIVNTNATRIGIILLLTFLVSILSSLYRYNMRLSAYYSARADALQLSRSLSHLGFIELAAGLTPHMDFGKSPQTPIEQVIELIRLGSQRGNGQ